LESVLESIIIRNRIKGHRRIRAGDLLPHELNWRNHPDRQKEALQALYQEVGFARSLLAFELPDGRLKLIDGHLRRDLSPDMFVDVEILDVNEEEARKLLLSLDTLPALAEPDEEVLSQLKEITKTDSPVLAQLWNSQAENETAAEAVLKEAEKTPVEQFLILVTCRNEFHQVELLEKFQSEGIPCRGLVS
jgi:hypothetical protein